jgi:RNA polymerase sigma factor (TIGR02999 family)
MTADNGASITELLARWKDGERSVENQLATLIYPMLRRMAGEQIRRNGHQVTLRPTALVSDAFERIAAQKTVDWQNREHFYAIASTILRRVLVDYLRQQRASKRGGDVCMVELDDPEALVVSSGGPLIDWIALDQALTRLAQIDPEAARVAELRLFAGLEVEEIAKVCDASLSTAYRQWRFARAWLASELGESGDQTRD